MSLQVWLPLTKDLRNQGLSDVSVTNYNTTYSSTGGKLGGCYIFPSGSGFLSIPNFNLNTTSFSACCWAKYTSFPSASNAYLISLNTSTSSDEQFILGIYSSNGTAASFRFNLSNDVSTLQLNTWYHFCITYENGVGKMYLNGELLKTASITSTTATNLIIGGRSTSSNGTTANGYTGEKYINDVRIYDHCLSQAEVREIAQGLVLHYPLRDPYIEATTNLLTANRSIGKSNWQSWMATTSGVSSPSLSYLTGDGLFGTNTYIKCQVYQGSGSNCAPYCGSLSMPENTRYTFSAWIKGDSSSYGKKIHCQIWCNDGTTTSQIGDDIILSSQWQLATASLVISASTTNAMYGFGTPTTQATSQDVIFYMCNAQLESKDHNTPWVMGETSRAETIVYDASGYNHNGTITGSLSLCSDSPRNTQGISFTSPGYSQSSQYNYIVADCTMPAMNTMTLSYWYSRTSSYNRGGYVSTSASNFTDYTSTAFNSYDSVYSFSTSSSNHYNISSNTYVPSDGTWHHYVYTYDGTTITFYKDGVATTTATTDGNPLLAFTKIGINFSYAGGGLRSETSKWSDVRLYATALSAEDIQNLYSNGITVDENEQIHAYEFKEE